MGDRDAAEMGADADHDQPLVVTLLDPGLVALRIGQARNLNLAGLFDLLLGAVADVNRLAAPEYLDVLPFGDRRQVDFDRRAGCDGPADRSPRGSEWPEGERAANRCGGSRSQKAAITPCGMRRRRRCPHDPKTFLIRSLWNRRRH